MNARGKVILLLLLLLIPTTVSAVVAGTFWYENTTAHFNAGIKGDIGDGNYLTETSTDNPNYTSGKILAASGMGDAFSKADADGITWKWINVSQGGTFTTDINTGEGGKLMMDVGAGGATGNYTAESTFNLTGEFDIQIDLDVDTFQISTMNNATFYAYVDEGNYVSVSRTYTAPNPFTWLQTVIRINYTTVLNQRYFYWRDDDNKLRIIRNNTDDLYVLHWNTSVPASPKWSQFGFNDSGFTNSSKIRIEAIAAVNNHNWKAKWDNFKVNEGALTTGGFRDTSYYISSEITPGNLRSWNTLTFNQSLNNSMRNVSFSILNAETNATIYPFLNISDRVTPLNVPESTLNPDTYPSIRIMAFFWGKGNNSAALDGWSVSWSEMDTSTSDVGTVVGLLAIIAAAIIPIIILLTKLGDFIKGDKTFAVIILIIIGMMFMTLLLSLSYVITTVI